MRNYGRTWGDIFKDIKSTDDYFEATKEGAIGGGYIGSVRTRDPLSMVRRKGPLRNPNVLDILMAPARAIADAGETSETITRLATWRELRDKNVPWLERATRTADVTTDFQQKGTLIRQLEAMVPFINPPFQQTRNLAGLARKRPGVFLFRAAMLSVPILMLEVWNRRFESYKDVPYYVHENNFVIMYKEVQEKADPRYPASPGKPQPRYIPIPKGYAARALTALAEAVLRISRAEGDLSFMEALLDAGVTMATAAFPLASGLQQFVPPGISTAIELQTNRDWFRERDIVPQSEQARAPEDQYGADTTSAAIGLGRVLGYSPRKIDFLIRDYFGTAGADATWVIGQVMDQLGFERKVPGEAWEPDQDVWQKLHGVPGIGRYFGVAASEQTGRDYERLDKQVRTTQRAYYENDEFRRLGKSVSAPGNTVTVDGVPYEIPTELRLRILEMETPLKQAALDALTTSPEWQAMTDI